MGDAEFYRDYYPFGQDRVASTTDETAYQFTGKEKDSNTGLIYFGARYYDPSIGRFISVDPLADKYPGWSPYVYALDNPLIVVDPDGNRPMTIGEKCIVEDIMRTAEQEYYFAQGMCKADPFCTNTPTTNNPIYGLEREGPLSGGISQLWEVIKSTFNLPQNNQKDPLKNEITGTDPRYGGDISVKIPSKQTAVITRIGRVDNWGDQIDLPENGVFIVGFYGENSEPIIQLTLTPEEFEQWNNQMQEYINEGIKYFKKVSNDGESGN
jgi:RHS repeat-associated protein